MQFIIDFIIGEKLVFNKIRILLALVNAFNEYDVQYVY